MKKTFILFLFFTIFYSGIAQLVITPNPTAVYAVEDVFMGQGVTVSNFQYAGANSAWATFTTGDTSSNLGFSAGVLLTTGNAFEVNRNAYNTPLSGRLNFNNGLGSDPQLAEIAEGTVYDRCVLEFDFIPINDTLVFRYVFASEEYPEFVNAFFNDVFGFFISGPSPSGGAYVHKNIAIIPETILPVAINNVNNGSASNNSVPNGPCNNCQYYIHNNYGSIENSNPYIGYDAMTSVLTAGIAVVPNQTYHVKIAIGDVGDGLFDSGIFIEAQSFSSLGSQNLYYSVISGNGSLSATANEVTIASGAAIPLGEDLVFTAEPDIGYQVREWKYNGEIVPENTSNVFMINNIQSVAYVTVEFEQIKYLVTYNVVGANGTLTATENSVDFPSGSMFYLGSDLVFTASPNAGYIVKEWTLNSNVISGNTSTTFAIQSLQEVSDVTVEFKSDNVGINDNEETLVNIYPNPSTGIFNIQSDAQYTMEVMDIQGRVIIRRQIESGLNELDMSIHHAGVYFVKLSNKEGVKVLKINKN